MVFVVIMIIIDLAVHLMDDDLYVVRSLLTGNTLKVLYIE